MTRYPADKKLASQSDEALMALTRDGVLRAFEELVRRHQSGVMNFFRVLGDYTHADDMAQETFVRLYRYRDRYRPRAGFSTFLYLLARRVRIDHQRAAQRRRDKLRAFAEDVQVLSAPDRGAAARQDRRERVREALARLPEEMRATVVLNVYQGLRYREIAEVLNIPLGTVKTRMFYAMRKLREWLDDAPE